LLTVFGKMARIFCRTVVSCWYWTVFCVINERNTAQFVAVWSRKLNRLYHLRHLEKRLGLGLETSRSRFRLGLERKGLVYIPAKRPEITHNANHWYTFARWRHLIVRMWSDKCRHLAIRFTLFVLCLISHYFPVFANY